jgi:UDP-N-acetylmuramate--alanine ligase
VLVLAIKKAGHLHVEYIAKPEETIEYLLQIVRPDDAVFTLGAGSVYKIGEAFLKKLAAREAK